jgi:AAA+ superfamily predicted ATPase
MIERVASAALFLCNQFSYLMNNSVNDYTNDEFYERLQELLENPLPVKEDSYFDSDEKLFGNTITTPMSKDIREITMTLSLPSMVKPFYAEGILNVNILARKGALIKENRFTCFVYSEDYFPMCNSEETGLFSRHSSNQVRIEMHSMHIWLPGNYTLFLRDHTDNSLTRIAFEIDETMFITQKQSVTCPSCSLDDILTTCIENSDSNWDAISTTPGASALRKYALQCRQLTIYNEYRKELHGKEIKCDRNLLIYTINKDWNEKVLQSFQKLAVPGHYLTYIDCTSLYNAALQNPYDLLNEKFSVTTNQVYCLTNPGALLNTGGKVIVKRIVEKMNEDDGDYKLWLIGNRHEIDSVMEVYPSLHELFLNENSLEQKPYTGFELVQAFFKELDDEHLVPAMQATDTLSRAVLQRQQCNPSTWSLGNIHRFVVEEIRPRYLYRALNNIMAANEDLPCLPLDDIPLDRLPNSTSEFEDSIRELNGMVGLDDIKKSITTMANQSRFFIERSKAGFHTSNKAAQHAVFTGNPGTGKTTVARMLGKIYHSIGLLSKGDVICADRTRLVGRYIGETEENMKAVLEEARGNVLFIDEAYNLYEGTVDRKDYGAKVIDSLLTVLSQPNPDMVIIFAGYEKEMDAMLTSNPGLMGRFPYKYRFSDYDADQLMEIALHLFAKDDYIITDDAKAILQQKICETLAQRTKNFGNARWVEQFIRNGIIPAMANRVTLDTVKDYQHILPSDIEDGYKKFNPRMIELKPRRQVGFSS